VICQDEMLESAEPEVFQQRLWNMFPHAFGRGVLSLPQLDRVRWNMFPQVRVQTHRRRCSTTTTRMPSCPTSCA
jgi:hypothetical protein